MTEAKRVVIAEGSYDALYAATDSMLWGKEPTHLLGQYVQRAHLGRALDLGCGDGVNAIWLEEYGFDVVGIDSSSIAMSKLYTRFRNEGREPEGHYVIGDASTATSLGEFDVLLSCGIYHCLSAKSRKSLHGRIQRQVLEGGLVLFSSLTDEIPLPDCHQTPDIDLPSIEEIRQLFSGLKVLSFVEGNIVDKHEPLVAEHEHSVVWVVAERSS